MTDLEVIIASHAAGEPVGVLPPDAETELAALQLLCMRLRQAAPAPSAARRDRVIELTRPIRQVSWFGLAAAASIFVAIGLLAVPLWNSRSGYVPQTPISKQVPDDPVKPDLPPPGQELPKRDYLKEEFEQVFANRVDEFSGSEPPRMGGGGQAPLDPQGLVPAVLLQAGFAALYWAEEPAGMELHGVSVVRAKESGLEFDMARIEYRKGKARLLLLQAAESDAADAKLTAPMYENGAGYATRRDGLVILALSNAMDAAALENVVRRLRPLPK